MLNKNSYSGRSDASRSSFQCKRRRRRIWEKRVIAEMLCIMCLIMDGGAPAVCFCFRKSLRHHVVCAFDDNFSHVFFLLLFVPFADFSCENQFARRSRRANCYIKRPRSRSSPQTFFLLLIRNVDNQPKPTLKSFNNSNGGKSRRSSDKCKKVSY